MPECARMRTPILLRLRVPVPVEGSESYYTRKTSFSRFLELELWYTLSKTTVVDENFISLNLCEILLQK